MLYWKDDIKLEFCKFCGDPRYKLQKVRKYRGKRSAYAVLRYLPLTPRLQRLYASSATVEHITWHASHHVKEGSMHHPSDAEAWKHFDCTHPYFAMEPRNVRLGLCVDEFVPHRQYGKMNSCWSVILTPYNLPPEMCMKSEFMFLTLVIPVLSNPKCLIDVYMQPLIEELLQLWHIGVRTYDRSTNEFFIMRAALMWTVNDLSTYEMVSGWNIAGVMGCPVCMDDTRTFRLPQQKNLLL
ncbi:UNVERIFIED_CONTAM: hypothetical protein Slati_3231900 [Sesamum latifolium]|uniref:Transposase n=1 Tax=Sesamum latifolium TaxID=2727402 RepID=A0AAW2UYW4_9LAMI